MRAVRELHRHRRVRGGDLIDLGRLIEIFVAVPVARLDPPGLAGRGDDEFGQLVSDAPGLAIGARGELVAKADAVVESAEADRDRAVGRLVVERVARAGRDEPHQQLVMPVGHGPALAPGLVPACIDAGGLAGDEAAVATEAVLIGELEAHARGRDQRLAVAADGILGPAFAIDRHVDPHPSIGRGDARDGARLRKRGRGERREPGEKG